MLELLNTISIPFLWLSMLDFIYFSLIFIISIWIHEFAHAYASVKLWDPTPKLQWRYTINPFAHIDPLGFIMIFLIHFGWWRPVEVNPAYYKNPLRDELITALAWPFSNIILAFLGIISYIILSLFVYDQLFLKFFQLFAYINIALAIFNLLPLPPLDWYRLIKFLKPQRWYWIEQNMLYLSLLFLIIIFSPWIWDLIKNFIISTTYLIYKLLYQISFFIVYLIFSIF